MTSCVFCDIIAGRAVASLVHRDALCTAFLTIQPVTAGHTLVVPNGHAERLDEIGPEEAARMFHVAQKIASSMPAADLQCEGVNLILCDGAAAGQTVPHAHLHVAPRHAGDGFDWVLPEAYRTPPMRDTLDHIAARLRSAMGGDAPADVRR